MKQLQSASAVTAWSIPNMYLFSRMVPRCNMFGRILKWYLIT